MSNRNASPVQWCYLLQVWLLIAWIPTLYDTVVYQVRLTFSDDTATLVSAATWLGYVPACIILPFAACLMANP